MKMIKSALVALLAILPMVCFAVGDYNYGGVEVLISSGGDPQLKGYYNVRYNPYDPTGTSYVKVQLTPGSSILVTGRDGIAGVNFSCNMTPTNTPNYYQMEGLFGPIAAGGNGTFITVLARQATGECYNVRLHSTSNYMD